MSLRKYLAQCLFIGLFALAVVPAKSTQASTGPDWSQINLRLSDVAADHTNAFGFIYDANAYVDLATTDWEQGNLGLHFAVQSTDLFLLSTPDPVTIQLNGALNLQTTDLGAQKNVKAQAEIVLKGDVVSVLRHINELIADCSIYDASETFLVHFCAYSEHVAQNDDVSTYQPALEALRDALLTLAPQQRPLPFANQKSWMDEVFSILTSALVTGDSTSASIVADIDLSSVLNLPIQGQAVLKMTNSALTISISGEALLDNADYDNYKQILLNGLTLLENTDPDFMSGMYQYSFLVFGLIEGFLN